MPHQNIDTNSLAELLGSLNGVSPGSEPPDAQLLTPEQIPSQVFSSPDEVTGTPQPQRQGGGGLGSILDIVKGVGASGALGPIGVAGSAAIGIGQLVSGIVQNRQARQLIPSGNDPFLQQGLRDVGARRRSFETGQAFQPAVDRFDAQTSGILRSAAGRAGTIGELSQVINQIGNQRSNFLGQLDQQSQGIQNQLLIQEVGIERELGQLRRSSELLRFQEKSQRGAANVTAGSDALLGVLARL